MSISQILQQNLDLIESEGSKNTAGNEVSAASALLEERKKNRRELNHVDGFVAFDQNQHKAVQRTDPLVSQAASSSVDNPQYWKSNSSYKGKQKVDHTKKAVKKRNQKSKLTGENYREKFEGRLLKKMQQKSKLSMV